MEAKETKFRCLGCGQLVTPTQNHPIECCESFKAGVEQHEKERIIEIIKNNTEDFSLTNITYFSINIINKINELK